EGEHNWVELKPILDTLTGGPDWLRTEDEKLLVPAYLSESGKKSLLALCSGGSQWPLVRSLRPNLALTWASSLTNAELYAIVGSAKPADIERWLGNIDNRAFAYWIDALHESNSLEEIEVGLRAREKARRAAKEVPKSRFLEMPLGLGKVPVRMFGPAAALVVLFLFLYLRLYLFELTKALRAEPSLSGESRSPFPWLIEFAYS